jgi:hypothetical protein
LSNFIAEYELLIDEAEITLVAPDADDAAPTATPIVLISTTAIADVAIRLILFEIIFPPNSFRESLDVQHIIKFTALEQFPRVVTNLRDSNTPRLSTYQPTREERYHLEGTSSALDHPRARPRSATNSVAIEILLLVNRRLYSGDIEGQSNRTVVCGIARRNFCVPRHWASESKENFGHNRVRPHEW